MMRIAVLLCALWCAPLLAQVESREFADAERQSLYASLLAELRCMVCANQSLADSNADLAKDLRVKVYAMVARGLGREEIIDYMSARYGEYVLYRPRLSAATFALWFAPFVLVIGGIIFLYRTARKTSRRAAAITPEQSRRAKSLLRDTRES